MTIRNDLMLDLQHAYRAGKAGIGDTSSENRTGILEQIQQWNDGFQPHEQVIKNLCVDVIRSTITAIRLGEFSKAEALLATVSALSQSSSVSRENRSALQSYSGAAAAYLAYKYGHYDQALAYLREALSIDEQLEQQDAVYGYLHLHRIMLLDNWVRVLMHRGQVLEAIELGFQILDYLEQKILTLPLPTTWNSALLTAYPIDGQSILFRTIASEIAEMVTGRTVIEQAGVEIQVRELFKLAKHHLSASDAGHGDLCQLSPAAHDWIQLKQAALDDHLPGFLQYAVRLLSGGPGRLPMLWYATLVEITLMSQRRSLRGIESFRHEVAHDIQNAVDATVIATWRHCPASWKAIISVI